MGGYSSPVPQMGFTVGRSSGKALELRGDLVSGVEVSSYRVGGGRASAVGSGRTALTC